MPKPIRKLVTLSAETAERVKCFQQAEGIRSESAALCRLIAETLAARDRQRVTDLLNGKN